MATLEERVQRLEDEEAIRQLLVEFVAGCDDGPYNADRIIEVFTDDAVMELGWLGHFEGREAIHAFFKDISGAITDTVHYQANYDVEIGPSGDEATGRWYGFEMPVYEGRAAWGAFVYEDRYRKQDGRWRIAFLNQRPGFWTSFDEGWVKQPLLES